MATTKYIDIRLRTKSAETNANKLDNKMKGLGATVDKTSNSFGVLSKVAAAVGTAIITGQITRYADAYTSLQNQVRQTTNSTQELTKRTKDLLDISNRSRAGISSTSELYTQLVLSTENLNLSTAEQLRLTETITKSFAVSGKSAADAAGSIRQLGQAFASGTLRGDEFNSIAEGAPEIMRALQRSLKLTQGELRDLAATGGITAKILVDALGQAASVIDTKFNDSTATMAQNIEVANNNLTEFIGSSTTVQNVMGGLGGAIVTASENIGTIASSAAVLASVFAARLVPSILTYSSSLISNTAAQLINGTAAVRTANVYGTVTVAAASATVATNALTLAARAATGAMALLGGPLGIVLIAGTALFAFNDVAFGTKEASEKGAEGVNELTLAMKKLEEQTTRSQLKEIVKIENDTLAKLDRAETKLENLRKLSDSTRGKKTFVFEAEREVAKLNKALDDAALKRTQLVGGIDTSGFDPIDNSGKSKTKEPEAAKQSPFSLRLSQETEALQVELALRQQVEQGYITQREADLSASFVNDSIRRTTAFEAELEKLGTDEEAKTLLTEEFKANQLLREQLFQEQITGIKETEEEKRLRIAAEAAQAENQIKASVTQNAIGLLQVLGRENKAAALAGIVIAKAMALSANAAATASGATLAFAAQQVPGDPSSFIRGTAAAAKVNALGAVNAGLIVATGLGQAASVFSGGSGALGATNSGTGSFQSQPTNQEAPIRSRTVDIRTDGSAFSEAVKDAALVLFNGGDDDVVLNITNAQNELVRTGVTG